MGQCNEARTCAKAWKAAARKNRIQAQTWQTLAVIAEGIGRETAKENATLRARLHTSEQRILAQQVPADREAIAAVQHEIWAHWTRYQFRVCQHNGDGTITIPAEKVERWTRQANTPYPELSDKERESDRDQADKVMAVLSASAAELLAWRRQAAVADIEAAGVEARGTVVTPTEATP